MAVEVCVGGGGRGYEKLKEKLFIFRQRWCCLIICVCVCVRACVSVRACVLNYYYENEANRVCLFEFWVHSVDARSPYNVVYLIQTQRCLSSVFLF